MKNMIGKLVIYNNEIYKILDELVFLDVNKNNNVMYILDKLKKNTNSTNGVVAFKEDFIIFKKQDYTNLNKNKNLVIA